MKNSLVKYIILFIIVFPLQVNAQIQHECNLRVIFIDHEPSLPSSDIIAYIRKQRTQALENGNALIVYMPNNQTPFISLTNIEDSDGVYDKETAFFQICEALNLPSHNKDPWFDRSKLIEMLTRQFPIADNKGDLNYYAVRMEFYLSKEFWTLGYNESIIAPLYFALDVKELLKKEFNFDVYVNGYSSMKLEKGKEFGEKNLGGISEYISLYDFNF